MNTPRLSQINGEQELAACFDLMRELRPHLSDAGAFMEQVRRQAGQDYHLLAAWQAQQVIGLAGYRMQENLLYGRFLYIDDLVVSHSGRSQGVGTLLIDAVREEAQRRHCAHLVLDTALGNALGQRFYFRRGLLSRGIHFSQTLKD